MDYQIYVINVMKPDNTLITYAFMGDTLISKEEFISKRGNYLSNLKQHLTVNDEIWNYHSSCICFFVFFISNLSKKRFKKY